MSASVYRDGMSDDLDGRANQKRRTRRDLLEAARTLLSEGATPTVAEVADSAGVSRRTAYRYFPTGEQLLADAALEGLREQVAASFEGVDDVEERVARLLKALLRTWKRDEHLLRTIVRTTVGDADRSGPRRGYRRLEWIDRVLEPVHARLGPAAYDDLRSALAVCIGTEAFIVLQDVCGKRVPQIERILVRSAQALVRDALAGAPAPTG
jgi:AcrR family transcriptional regulator